MKVSRFSLVSLCGWEDLVAYLDRDSSAEEKMRPKVGRQVKKLNDIANFGLVVSSPSSF